MPNLLVVLVILNTHKIHKIQLGKSEPASVLGLV